MTGEKIIVNKTMRIGYCSAERFLGIFVQQAWVLRHTGQETNVEYVKNTVKIWTRLWNLNNHIIIPASSRTIKNVGPPKNRPEHTLVQYFTRIAPPVKCPNSQVQLMAPRRIPIPAEWDWADGVEGSQEEDITLEY